MSTAMSAEREVAAPILPAVCAWLATVHFGGLLLDMVYARSVRAAVEPAQAASVFAEPADFLLLIFGCTALAALAALGSSWRAAAARNWLIAAVLAIAAQLVAPAVLGSMASEPGAGWWLRLLLSGAASLATLLALWSYVRRP